MRLWRLMQCAGISRFIKGTIISVSVFLLLMLVHLFFFDHSPAIRVADGYSGDSFHHLTRLQGVSLALISFVAVIALLFFSWHLTETFQKQIHLVRLPVAVLDILLAVVTYWLLLSMVPQLYFVYYRNIMPGLPAQWVVSGLIPLPNYIQLYKLSYTAPLADHAAGLAGWILLLNKIQQWFLYGNK